MSRNFVAASSQSLEVSSAILTTTPLSMAVWYRPTSSGINAALLTLSNNAADNRMELRCNGSSQCLVLDYDGVSAATAISSATATNGQWSHFAGVWTSHSNRTAYLDGAGVNDTTLTPATSGLNRTTVGAVHSGAALGNFANGDIAEAAIWNVALSAADIASLALGVSPALIRPDALVFYAPLYGTYSPEIEVRGAKSLTLSNAPIQATHPRIFTAGAVNNPIRSTSPTVATTVPSSDRATGGDTITLLGTNFRAGASVTVGGVAATSVVVISGTRITFTAPANAAGIVDIVVTNSDTTSGTLASSFTYYAVTADLTKPIYSISGADPGIKRESLSISLTPDKGTATFEIPTGGTRPVPFADIRFGLGSLADRDLIFRGKQQNTGQFRRETVANQWWSGAAVDASAEFNRYLAWGTYTTVPFDVVALDLLSKFAPDFTGVNIQTGLGNVSIIFEGVTMDTAFQALATAAGGYFYKDSAYDVHLFVTESSAYTPETIDTVTSSLLMDPPLTWWADVTNVRNRVIGIGANTTVLSALNIGETIIPLADVTIFDDSANTLKVGAQRVTYTNKVVASGGTLVGTGATPAVAPAVALAAGTGMGTGAYQYAYTDVTAAGESLPSPLATITTGSTTVPGTAPTAGAATSAGSVDVGSHDYEVTFVTASGETTPSPVSAASAATNAPVPDPSAALTWVVSAVVASTWDGFDLTFQYAYSTGVSTTDFTKMTAVSPNSAVWPGSSNNHREPTWSIPYSTNPLVTYIVVFYTFTGGGGGPFTPNNGALVYANNTAGGTLTTTSPHWSSAVQNATSNNTPTTSLQTIPVSAIPIGSAEVTSRKLYRRFNGAGTFNLVTTIANNTATTYTDTTANASLGAAAPSSNTATAQRVSVSSIAVGPSAVTSRKVYRTAVGASQLKLLTTIADNVTTTFADSTADGSLGANAPTSDASGLSQPPGQVNAGSTSIITASAAAFRSTGGWAASSRMLIRYTGISGNTLTGVPSSGNGSVSTTLLYGAQLVPVALLIGVPSSGVGSFLGAAPINAIASLYCERNNVSSQTTIAAIEGGNSTGVYEFKIEDSTIVTQTALNSRCDADLAQWSSAAGIIKIAFTSFDRNLYPGRAVSINRLIDGIVGTFVIQTVDISNIGEADNTYPRRSCTATSVRYSLQDVLRRLKLNQQ